MPGGSQGQFANTLEKALFMLTFRDQAQYSEFQAVPGVDHRMHEGRKEPVEHPRVSVNSRTTDIGLGGEDVFLEDLGDVFLEQEVPEVLQIRVVKPGIQRLAHGATTT